MIGTFAVVEAAMRIDEFALPEGWIPSETRLMALLAVVGHKSPGSALPSPHLSVGGARVYAFPLASQAVVAAMDALKTGNRAVASVWLGEFEPNATQVKSKIRRAIACTEFGEPGQVVLTLAAIETARELLPEGSSVMELGNRATEGGIIERLFVIESSRRSGAHPSEIDHRNARLRFIGRERERTELEDRITRYRLVTVSGPAGIGKTALVRRVFDEMDPLTNTWYLDTSRLASPALLASALTSTLDIRKEPLETHSEVLLARAGNLNGFLILDCGAGELPEVRSLVRQLLGVAPNLAIIVVAPRSLRLPNESVLPLRGLDYPKTRESVDALLEFDSVVYFESRAAAVMPRYAISERDLEAVGMICRRLQGNPAALTLAVNKLRALTPRQILDRLDQPLDFLKGTFEQSPERHESLQKMIAVTVAPLSDQAKSLLGCLSIMEGAAGLDDVEAMFPKDAALHGFEELIDAGLLDVAGASIDVKRFTMSASTRAFARKGLSPKAFDAIHGAHLDYFERVALQSATGLAGPDQSSWVRRMEEQCSDISAVARVLAKRGKLERACQMLVSGITFWYERNFPNEALALADTILRMKQPFPSRARLENFAAMMAMRLGELKLAEAYARRGLERAVASRNVRFQIFLTGTLGGICHTRNDHKGNSRYQRKSAQLARDSGEPFLLYIALTNLLASLPHIDPLGDYTDRIKEALSLETNETPTSWRARLRNNIANGDLLTGNISRSKSFCQEALILLRESGHWVSAAASVRTLAHALIREGRNADAATLFGGAFCLVEQDEGRLSEYERDMTESGIQAVIAALGVERFQDLFDYGQRLIAEDIMAIAIEYAAT